MEKAIEKYLNENYIMIKKGRLYQFLGGAVATILLLLSLTYATAIQSVNHVIKETDVKHASTQIMEMYADSNVIYTKLKNMIMDVTLYSTGSVQKGDTIPVPSGTTTDQWKILLIPLEIGYKEAIQFDNALLRYTASAKEIEDKSGWKVDATNLFRYGNNDSSIESKPCSMTYIIINRKYCFNECDELDKK